MGYLLFAFLPVGSHIICSFLFSDIDFTEWINRKQFILVWISLHPLKYGTFLLSDLLEELIENRLLCSQSSPNSIKN